MFAGLGGSDRNLGVRVGWSRDVDDVNIGTSYHFPPVGGTFLPAKLFGRLA